MFALPNLNVLCSSISQMPLLAKYGLPQSASFSTIRKYPEIDVNCNELTQSIQYIRDLNYDKFLDFVIRSRFNLAIMPPEWSSLEETYYIQKARRDSRALNANWKEGTVLVKSSNESEKQEEEINSEKINYDVKFSEKAEISNSSDQLSPMDNSSFPKMEMKKYPSFVSRFMQNALNQTNFNNETLFGAGHILHINDNGLLRHQKMGFKTQRRIKEKENNQLFQKLVNVATVKKSEQESNEKSQNTQGKGISLKWFLDALRVVAYCSGILICFDFYRSAFSKKFASAHVQSDKVKVKFSDVKGMEEAKKELMTVVEMLRNPRKFMQLGGKLPSGILLQGPPGTGKTLLARAVAGEANVEFFQVSGSEFDEILVGEGARRIRNLFMAARKAAPAVIFIDEIDAIGGRRVNSALHPYANQTIIQLLAEMDGFVAKDKIVVIGATNRPRDLDEALLRPGRFDLRIQVMEPDIKGRMEILKLYVEKIVCKNINIARIAKKTVGFTGADLENVVNQAALAAAVQGCNYVTNDHIDEAIEKVMLGPALKSRVRTPQTNELIAYHESGHATVAYFTKSSNPPIKASILQHMNALGHTSILNEEKLSHTKEELLAMMDVALGGRVAEELIFGPDKVTTGCTNDLENATNIATNLVCTWGMSDNFGLRTLAGPKKSVDDDSSVGDITKHEIDGEIKKLLQESYERVKKILKDHAVEHKELAMKLLVKEVLDEEEIRQILDRQKKS